MQCVHGKTGSHTHTHTHTRAHTPHTHAHTLYYTHTHHTHTHARTHTHAYYTHYIRTQNHSQVKDHIMESVINQHFMKVHCSTSNNISVTSQGYTSPMLGCLSSLHILASLSNFCRSTQHNDKTPTPQISYYQDGVVIISRVNNKRCIIHP